MQVKAFLFAVNLATFYYRSIGSTSQFCTWQEVHHPTALRYNTVRGEVSYEYSLVQRIEW